MIVLILCAGKGTRMQPLSDDIAKPLLPIDHKPVIYHTIKSMQELNFTDIGIVLRETDLKQFERFLAKYFTSDPIDIFIQEQLTGIITAIRSATKYENKQILACAGDTRFQTDHIREFLYNQNLADIVIGVTKRSEEQILKRSNIVMDEENVIINTIEKPSRDEIETEWSGVPIWMFGEEIWPYFKKSHISSNGEYAVEGVIDLAIRDKKMVKGIEINGTKDITTPSDVLKHNFDYIDLLLD